jgi:hypothetical protein
MKNGKGIFKWGDRRGSIKKLEGEIVLQNRCLVWENSIRDGEKI